MATKDFNVMVSSILLVIVIFGILLTTGKPQTGNTVVDSPQLTQLELDEIDICKSVGGTAYVITKSKGVEVKCDLSEFDNRIL